MSLPHSPACFAVSVTCPPLKVAVTGRSGLPLTAVARFSATVAAAALRAAAARTRVPAMYRQSGDADVTVPLMLTAPSAFSPSSASGTPMQSIFVTGLAFSHAAHMAAAWLPRPKRAMACSALMGRWSVKGSAVPALVPEVNICPTSRPV